MAQTADRVFAAGLELDPAQRLAVAQRLLESLDAESPDHQADIDAAWSEEIRSRVDDVLDERVALSSFEETRARARVLLDELRT